MDLVATFGDLGDWHEVAATMSVVGDVDVRHVTGVEVDDESRQRAGRSVGADDFRAQSQFHRSCHLNPPIVLPTPTSSAAAVTVGRAMALGTSGRAKEVPARPDVRSTRRHSSNRDEIQRLFTVGRRIIESRPLKHRRSRAVLRADLVLQRSAKNAGGTLSATVMPSGSRERGRVNRQGVGARPAFGHPRARLRPTTPLGARPRASSQAARRRRERPRRSCRRIADNAPG